MKLIFSLTMLATAVTSLPQPNSNIRRSGLRVNPKARANQVIPVVVGGPQDTFAPNSVVAAVGDVVQFQFSNGNHTVTQSTADAACAPMEGGIHSGHIPFEDGQTDVGTFNMPVTSTDPMFLYCATGPHCQEGQVMIVNPTNAQQVVDYVKASQATNASTDGSSVVGGTTGKIALDTAAFVPAPPEEEAAAPPPPPAEEAAPPAEEAAPPAEEAAEKPAEGEAEKPTEGEAAPAEGEAAPPA